MQLKRNMMTLALISAGIGFATCANVAFAASAPASGAQDQAQPDASEDRARSHGLSEAQLRELIAQDLRGFLRRPLAAPAGAGASPDRPFLLDRLMGAAG